MDDQYKLPLDYPSREAVSIYTERLGVVLAVSSVTLVVGVCVLVLSSVLSSITRAAVLKTCGVRALLVAVGVALAWRHWQRRAYSWIRGRGLVIRIPTFATSPEFLFAVTLLAIVVLAIKVVLL